MFSGRRSTSILTVNFKKQLSSPLRRTFFYGANIEPKPIKGTSRLVALMADYIESMQCLIAHLTHLFCSSGLKVSANFGFLSETKQLHSHVIKLGYFEALSMQNQVLHGYVRCGSFHDADKLFVEMHVRNIVAWNTLISGAVCCHSNVVSSRKYHLGLGLCYFRRMLMEMVGPDSTTMNALIRWCVEMGDAAIGEQFHGFVVKFGLSSDHYVGGATVDLYGKCGLVREARCAFDEMEVRDLVSWNVMISAYASNGLIEEAFGVFRLLQLGDVRGDEFTFASLLSSCRLCGWCELGKQFHGLVTKISFDLDLRVASSLADLYAKDGLLYDARKIFDGMIVRSLVTWNTMISGYGQHGYGNEAMAIFVEMLTRNVNPDELTVASIVSSCGNLSATSEVTQVQAYAIKNGFEAYSSVANALIVAYSNCGSLANARQCFNSIAKPDFISWTSILSAHGFHGHVEGSIEIFQTMVLRGVRLDGVAFLQVMSACSHGGLTREGLCYFELMVNDYNITPSPEHYACLVDLLGRGGLRMKLQAF